VGGYDKKTGKKLAGERIPHEEELSLRTKQREAAQKKER